jgi:hypothetical protein
MQTYWDKPIVWLLWDPQPAEQFDALRERTKPLAMDFAKKIKDTGFKVRVGLDQMRIKTLSRLCEDDIQDTGFKKLR